MDISHLKVSAKAGKFVASKRLEINNYLFIVTSSYSSLVFRFLIELLKLSDVTRLSNSLS